VLADVDASLAAWLTPGLPAGARIDFASPAGLLDHRRTGKAACTVNLFLHDIVAEDDGMAASPVRIRDADGRVRATELPLRRYRLSYLLTVWAGDAGEEHRVLGMVLARHSGLDQLGGELLCGGLRDFGLPLPVRLGVPQAAAGEPGIWAALGVPARTSVELVVVAPVPPATITEVAPPVERVEVHARQLPAPNHPIRPRQERP
jgi:hypothetical protein